MKKRERREALVYHAKPNPGKIEVVPTTKYNSQRHLSLAYSPGVAHPCIEIDNDKNNVYKYLFSNKTRVSVQKASAKAVVDNLLNFIK